MFECMHAAAACAACMARIVGLRLLPYLQFAAIRPRLCSVAASGANRFASMGKRKQDTDSEPELDSEEIDEQETKKPKRKAAPRKTKPKFSEPFTDELGWNVEPPSIIWRDFGSKPSEKIAAFDLDGTLVNTKSNRQFAQHAGDWKFWNKKTPKKLQELAEEGYKIVIFTNQGSIKSALDGKAAKTVKDKCAGVANALQSEANVSVQIFIAPCMAEGDPARKPATGMWEFMSSRCNGGVEIDKSSSFFVGDADGSHAAHSDSDKKFAEGVGIEFKTPADVLGPLEGKPLIDREAVKAGKAEVEAGTHPNAELIKQFEDAAKKAFESGEPAYKGAAYRKVADSLTTFHSKVSLDNMKEVGKLQGVGKGSVERIKQYLSCGSIWGPEAAMEQKEATAAQEQKVGKATEVALKFM